MNMKNKNIGSFKAMVSRVPASQVNDVAYLVNNFIDEDDDVTSSESTSLFHLSCSDQPGITISSSKYPSNVVVIDERNDTGMRSLSVDPLGEYVAAVGLDGKLRIHYVANSCLLSLSSCDNNKANIDIIDVEENVLVESCMTRIDGSEESRQQVGQCAWHPEGKCLALAGRSNVVLKVCTFILHPKLFKKNKTHLYLSISTAMRTLLDCLIVLFFWL
jgi:hypothetical protein